MRTKFPTPYFLDGRSRYLELKPKHTVNNTPTRSVSILKDTGTPIIPLNEVRRFMKECLEAAGAKSEHAHAMAELLSEADYRGYYGHGMNRLEMYMKDLKSSGTDGKATPKILKETPATAWVDGRNALGAVVGNFCMKIAIKKAKEAGIGCVSCKGSNHFGIAAKYPLLAQKEGFIGFSATNTSPFMAPTRAKKSCLGTNPVSVAAPSTGNDYFLLDMSTTVVAAGKIEIQKRKNEPIPEGWAIDSGGHVTTDPNASAAMMPLGGMEFNSGYKGYGLGLMVETLCGILGGSNYGYKIRKWGSTSEPANLGQFFMAIDPNCFAPGFQERMADLMRYLRGMEPAEKDKPVLVPGDPERIHMQAVDKAGGIRYVKNQMETCAELAKTYNVKPLKSL